mgnify:CR=1 FL=1
MIENIVIWPLAVHLLFSLILMFGWKNVDFQKKVTIVGNIISLGVAVYLFIFTYDNGTQTLAAGGWKAPFGIVFVSDLFAATLVLLTAISGFAVSIFSIVSIRTERLRFGFFSVYHFLLLGLNGAFLTGDIFNLYVWFEIIIISSFVLISIGGEKNQLEGAVKYFALNFMASMIFLTGLGLIYGLTGTLNMADLSLKIADVENRSLVNICGVLFFVGFGIKSAVFPLYFWLPASYHTPPSAVSAIFGGLLTKVGVYALIRVFTLIFVQDQFLQNLILGIAFFTIISGAFGALINNDLRKIFSYLIICHIGFIIGGLGMYTEIALAGALFYLVHDIMVKTNLYLISGLIHKIKGSTDIKQLGNIYKDYPKISVLVAIVLFSLVGVPPLSGFWPKVSLFQAGFANGNYWYIGALIFGSLITLIIAAKIWSEVFWKNADTTKPAESFVQFNKLKNMQKTQFVIPISILAFVSIYIGFGAQHIQEVVAEIAHDLMNNESYINAVLK